MNIQIHRLHFTAYGTGGNLYINGQIICNTLEHPDHLIPEGTYAIHIRHSNFLNRKVPFIVSPTVIPIGKKWQTTPHLSIGNGPFGKQCRRGNILIGTLAMRGLIIHSSPTFSKLIDRLEQSIRRGHTVTLTIN